MSMIEIRPFYGRLYNIIINSFVRMCEVRNNITLYRNKLQCNYKSSKINKNAGVSAG